MDEIEALKQFTFKPTKWKNVEIKFCCHMTKLDQKIVCYLKGKKGMMQCPYCDATPTNRLLNETQFFSATTLIDLGLSGLHFGINSIKLIINVGSNQVRNGKLEKLNSKCPYSLLLIHRNFNLMKPEVK